MPTICNRCQTNPRRNNSTYCRECINELNRESYRRNREARSALKKAHRTEIKDAKPFVCLLGIAANNAKGEHLLRYIGAFDGNKEGRISISLRNDEDHIRTEDVMERFLLPLARQYGKAKAFYVSYEIDYLIGLIMHDLSEFEWLQLLETRHDQRRRFAIRHSRELIRGTDGKKHYKRYRLNYRKGNNKTSTLQVTFVDEPDRPTLTLVDVADFFGGKFSDAVWRYLGHTLTENQSRRLQLVRDFENIRYNFSFDDDFMPYWKAYASLFPKLMNALRDSLNKYLNAHLGKWDSATELTSLMLRRHNIAQSIRTPPEMENIFKQACVGPRIQTFHVGNHSGPVANEDLSMAYGAGAMHVRDPRYGKWLHVKGADFDWSRDFVEYGIYHLDYASPFTARPAMAYPIPIRIRGDLYFPDHATALIWGPEALLAKHDARVLDAFIFMPEADYFPLRPLVEELVAARAAAAEEGLDAPIKQALARLIGKFSQRVVEGKYDFMTQDRLPAYQPSFRQLEWAGFMYSYTRAALFQRMKLARQTGHKILSCHTDGFLRTATSLEPDRDILPPGLSLDDAPPQPGDWRVKGLYEYATILNGIRYLGVPFSDSIVVVKPGHAIVPSREGALELMRKPNIWTEKYVIPDRKFSRKWIHEEEHSLLGNFGKQVHYPQHCTSCHEGLSPAEALHPLVARRPSSAH